MRVELCELPGRDVDVVIREDALPRFWQTIEEVLVEVFGWRDAKDAMML